ncbi:hypothetical protein ORV05_10450 [Amycolatopsis cynarae]|uniref:ABC transporter substrate-binding protein n=1 Tax=Amycolatopsis cynarae TaxID=2995223 RepID=A0ABY7B765_9PSEU|nr:hypothetical protein [Amycolatopsis sp. HUAS 11-8]WAL68160.1 hypothetical protein ORV05_10450 [Amycolatopsis sp. HUAS 11-8]
MTETPGVPVPPHDGAQQQYYHSVVVNISEMSEIVARQAREPRLVPAEDLRWLRPRFLAPPGLGLARARLQESRMVLLTGQPGSGRRTAGKMLLSESAAPGSPFTMLDDEAHDPREKLSEVHPDSGHRLLLDLSASTDEAFRCRQRELPAFRTVLRQRDAYLVVVVPDRREHQIDGELSEFVVRIGRPDGAVVLRRHLESASISPGERDLGAKPLVAHLAAPMRDIAELARMVVQARDRGTPGGVRAWLDEAVSAVDRGGEVSDQMRKYSSGRMRAVLLAAAMCEGASADAVFFASDHLLRLLKVGESASRLEQDGHHANLDVLGVELGEDDAARFGRYAYDRAVRSHFWDNYPDLRERFRDWADEIVRLPQLMPRDRKRIVERFVEQSFRAGTPDPVVTLVTGWVRPKQNEPKYLVELGVQALLTGLRDERHGWRFRRLVYDWSCDEALPADLGQLVVEVCTEVIAPDFPDQALVRLHHRARREDGSGRPSARRALWQLTGRDRMLLRRWLSRLTEKMQQPGRWQRADVALFLDVAVPLHAGYDGARGQALVTDASLRSSVVTGWRVGMVVQPDLIWAAVPRWLSAAAASPAPDRLLAILVEAADRDVTLLGDLHVVARNWSLHEHGGPEVAARLARLIDRAQGIEPADFVLPRETEEAVR